MSITTTTTTTAPVVSVAKGDIVTGKVIKKLTKKDGDRETSIGLIVKFGKSTGLVHVSKLAEPTIATREAAFAAAKVGDSVTAEVIEVREDGKIALSMQAQARKAALDALKSGAVIEGTVKGIAKKTGERGEYAYGVFVAVTPFHDGLLHGSELVGADRKAQLRRLDSITKGMTVKVVAKEVSVDGDKVRISLSETQAVARETEARKAAESAARAEAGKERIATLEADDTQHMVRVSADRGDGLMVLIDGCVEAFLPNDDIVAPRASVKKVGTSFRAKVVEVNRETGAVRVTRKGL